MVEMTTPQQTVWNIRPLRDLILAFRCPYAGHECARRGLLWVLLARGKDMGGLMTKWTMDWAACNGHLEVVKWLHVNSTEGCTAHAMDWAAACGHLEVVKWLHLNRSEGCTHWAMIWAVANDRLDVAQWLRENGLTI